MLKPSARSPSLTSQESYSGVIIADLVADVPVQSDSERRASKATKEETNLGYDGHMDGETSPAVVSVETEMANMHSMKSNGAGISKGVILIAVQFEKTDTNGKIDEKPIQLTNALSATPPITQPSGFKDMSVPRKIAFVFSFLPSILFVLCFAVILPCKVPSPCVEELWLTRINNAEATSKLSITPNVAFTLLEEDGNFFMTLSASTGSEMSKIKFPAAASYMNCGKVINAEVNHCIVMDETGKVHVFNSSDGGFLWNPIAEEKTSEKRPNPVILPDCNNDGFEDVAVAVSNSQVNVMYKGNAFSNFKIPYCESMPSRLIPWIRNNSSDIIFTCVKDTKDAFVKVPQSTWCIDNEKSPGSTWMLHPQMESSRGYILHPTEDGLVLWSGDEVSMLLPNGDLQWKFSNNSHSDRNRFILHGNFISEKQQIALFSSDISSNLEVTILNSADGSVMKSNSIPNSEATDILQIQGKERDFTLLLLKKKNKNVVSKALEHIDDISTTIVNYISNEEFNDTRNVSSNDISEELTFFNLLDGSLHFIRDIKSSDKQGGIYNVSMTAAQDKKNDLLHIYLLSTLFNNVSPKITEIKSIKVANWDITTSKSLECALK